MPVVRLSDGRDAVRAYVTEQASQGLPHVIGLLKTDNDQVLGLIGDLSDEEGLAVTPVDPWCVADALRHMAASLDRSKERLAALSSGQPYQNPTGGGPGQMGDREYGSFDELRRTYVDGMTAIIGVLERADGSRGLELTAEHAGFGPFNWLEWAVYSHHVHTHDHIGQLEAIRSALKAI